MKTRFHFLLMVLWMCFLTNPQTYAQGGVAINSSGASPDSTAILDVSSTSKGFLMPRLTQTQRDAIVNPAMGLMIFNLSTTCVNIWGGSGWIQICGNSYTCNSIAGTASANTGNVGCGGTVNLSLSGYNGTIQWQSSGDNINFSDITGATSAAYTASIDYTNNYFRATVTDGNCTSVHSNTVTVTGSGNCCTSNNWTSLASYGGNGRWLGVGFSIGNYGYIGAGSKGDNTNLSDFWKYDPSNNSWSQIASYPGGAFQQGVGFSIGNYGYAGTGYNYQSNVDRNSFYRYDPSNNTWTVRANYPTTMSNSFAMVVGNYGYVGAGYSHSLGNTTGAFYQYDPVNDVWTPKSDYPGPRTGSSAFGIGNFGYAGVGGNSSTFMKYDPATDSWTNATGCTVGLNICAAFTIGGYGYLVTGSYGNTMYRFDAANNSWTSKANYPGGGRGGAVGFSIGGKGYVGTGLDLSNNDHVDFWQYCP